MRNKLLGLLVILITATSINQAQNLQNELHKLYVEKQYDVLLEKTDQYLKDNPDNSLVNLIRGRVLVDMGRFVEGKPFLKNAIKHDKNNSWRTAWGLCYLGMANYRQGFRKEAKKNLVDCLSMNATRNVTKMSKRMLLILGLDNQYNDWEKYETDNFIFYFQPNTVVTNIDSFANVRQNAFEEVNSFFNVEIPKKIDFFVWNENEDAKQNGIPTLGFAKPIFCVIHSRYNQTLGHEITHVISHYYTNIKNKTRFINEGLAVAFDLSKKNNLEIAKQLKKEDNIDGSISVVEAWKDPKKYSEWVYYPFAGEFIKRLLEKGGKEKLLKLVSNQSYESAKNIYGNVLDEIIKDLENDIN